MMLVRLADKLDSVSLVLRRWSEWYQSLWKVAYVSYLGSGFTAGLVVSYLENGSVWKVVFGFCVGVASCALIRCFERLAK